MTHSKPPITSTKHVVPFDKLSPLDFERLCLWLVEREGYVRAEHLGLAGSEQGRDVVAYKPTPDGEELWYFQCKRYASIRAKTLKDEVDKYLELAQEKPHLNPCGVVFAVSCAASAKVREEVGGYCREHGLAHEFWALTELDLRIKQHPDLLREFFGLPTRPVGMPFQVPPLPAHFVSRLEVSDALKTRLLADHTSAPGLLVVSAIHGLGGIGKSVLAAALAHDAEVQARFPGGVLWATLGQNPDLLSVLSSWIQALGDYGFYPTTVEAASTHLRTLLHDKAVLLVVDDVWDPAHAIPFLVGGSRCQVLITTRRADVADEVGADLYQLDVMTPGQSLHLLAARLGCSLAETEQDEALRLAEAVGYLPLALELAAARVARGISWKALRETLEEEIARLETLEGPHRKTHSRLEASFNLSLDALRGENGEAWCAFAWLGVLPEDVDVTAPMAATLWKMDQAQAAKTLELLWNDALLLPGPQVWIGDGRWLSYRIHDLLHTMARRLLTTEQPQGLGFKLPEAHACVLERYRGQTQDRLWHTLPDDSYIHAHLTWHMEGAGWEDELHALLREETAEGRNGWYEVCDLLRQTAGFLEAVIRGWRLAEERFAVSLQVRYALIIASLNSLAMSIPTDLMIALVEKGVWSPVQGLAYARQIPILNKRSKVLVSIARYFSKVDRLGVLGEALAAARRIKLEEHRARSLVELAPYLPEPLLQEALALVQAVKDKWARAEALVDLTPHLPGVDRAVVVEEVLAAARTVRHKPRRADLLMKRQAELLMNLTPYLPEVDRIAVLQEVLAMTREIRNSLWKVETLEKLVPLLPKAGRDAVAEETLVMAQELWNERARVKILVNLAPYLPENHLKKVLAAVREVGDEGARVEALLNLAPYLPDMDLMDVLGKTLVTARSLWSGRARVKILLNLVPDLPEANRSVLLDEALAEARMIKPAQTRAEALVDLASYLSGVNRVAVLEEAWTAARNISDQRQRVEALINLAPHLSKANQVVVLNEALAVTYAVGDSDDRTMALVGLAPYTSGVLLEEALAVARQLPRVGSLGECPQAAALVRLAPHLSEDLLREALQAVQALPAYQSWLSPQAWALEKLAPYLSENLLEEALQVAERIDDAPYRAQALTRLAQHLPEAGRLAVLEEALAAVQVSNAMMMGCKALLDLVPYLPKRLLEEALIVAREITVEPERAQALAGLAPYLPQPNRGAVLEEALTAARRVRDEGARARILGDLAQHLPEICRGAVLKEALATARKISNGQVRVKTLVDLALPLPEKDRFAVLQEALMATREIPEEYYRSEALIRLAPYLPEPLLGEAIEMTWKIGMEYSRVQILTKLIPRLAELGHVQEALMAAKSIEDEVARVEAMLGLMPQLSEANSVVVVEDALAAARKIIWENVRSEALVGLIPHLVELPLASMYSFWHETLPVLATRTRKELLSDLRALAPVIHALGGEDAIAETFGAIQDVGRWWP